MGVWLHPSRSLFGPKAEAINLLLPFAFVAAFVIALTAGWKPTSEETSALVFLRNFVFFDSIHTIFTFVMLALLPEGRRLVKEATQKSRIWIFLGAAFLLATASFEALLYGPHLDPVWSKLVIGIILGLSLQHVGGQIFGISTMYNHEALRQVHLNAVDAGRFKTLQVREAKAFQWVIHLQWLAPFAVDKTLGIPSVLIDGYVSALLLASGIILYGSWRMNRLVPSNKFIFQLRLIFWPLAPAHEIGAMFLASLHGVEYLFINQRLLANSSWHKTWLRVGALCTVVFIGYAAFRQFLWSFSPQQQTWIVIAAIGLCRSFDLTHYYLDSAIFRFRNEESRRLLAPLLERPLNLPKPAIQSHNKVYEENYFTPLYSGEREHLVQAEKI